MIVFGIQCNFFIVLPNQLKICRLMDFFFFFEGKIWRARKTGRISEVLRARVRLIGIGRTICSGLNYLQLALIAYWNQCSGEVFSTSLHLWKSEGQITNLSTRHTKQDWEACQMFFHARKILTNKIIKFLSRERSSKHCHHIRANGSSLCSYKSRKQIFKFSTYFQFLLFLLLFV